MERRHGPLNTKKNRLFDVAASINDAKARKSKM
jgi:hypothetical protein